MRTISFNARLAADAESTDEIEVVLIKITHPLLDAPIRLSSDNTERLSVDPLAYVTRSTWLTDDGSPFKFILMGTQIPDETSEEAPSGNIVIADLDSEIAEVLCSTTVPATVSMALVYASSPDVVEHEFLDMKLRSAEIDGDQIVLSFSKEPVLEESYPAARMTKERFPGLYA
ncbi:hypothetical protein [Mesorhizobium sp. J428]|uniref:hypothetical protein n=1 Tax=Mesorhizobium sp. J428 TaxID=2898440 RepID=UPI0021510B84|nr:hypothetical protein [Mesorhizobium sp. J428]MCR5856000.1 hypothetical protein [Mesorhizobium sp. J428]